MIRRPPRKKENWLLPYSVLMTILFSLFVVLYAAAQRNGATAPTDQTETEARAHTDDLDVVTAGVLAWPGMMKGLEDAFGGGGRRGADLGVETRVVEDGLLLRFALRELFAEGSSVIPARHLRWVDQVAEVLLEQGAPKLRIEGQVEADEAQGLLRAGVSASELSALRAVSIANRWILKSGFPAEKITVMGSSTPHGTHQLVVRVLKAR